MLMNSLTTSRHKITSRIARLYSKLIQTPCLLCGLVTQQHGLCLACAHSLPQLSHLCERCALPIALGHQCGQCLIKPPIRHLTHCLFPYQAPIDRLIAALKYHDQLAIVSFFSQHMTNHIKKHAEAMPDLLMPIPLHPKRLRQRGYNQSAELAKALSKQLAIPYDNHTLTRIKNTLPQTILPYSERKKNIHSAFKCNTRTLPPHIALIDDVLTTGHTADMAAKALIQNGVKKVELWTLTRTIRHYSLYE
jgi:ComF family protein